jgi:hypothetical protein
MIVDIVDTVVCSSIHAPIIPNVQLFVNMLIASRKAAPFILPHKGVGFQGQRSIKQIKTYTGERKALYTDFALAKLATRLLGRNKPYSDDAVRKAREKLHIEPSTDLGGARQGAGRPRGSGNKHSNPQPGLHRRHNLTIGTAALVEACLSAYKIRRDSKNAVALPEVWDYIAGATRPSDLPARYSPAPKALMGRSGKPFRPSLGDAQKLQATKGL